MSQGRQKDCYRFSVRGKVQGVFFRASTRDQASRLGLTGWVRNLSSGDVELLACGDREKIDMLSNWLWQGPRNAKVTDVITEKLPGSEADVQQGFKVRRDG
jgi:acylphosphatase